MTDDSDTDTIWREGESDSVSFTQTVTIPEDFDGEIEGAAPIAELEQLADEWRETAEEMSDTSNTVSAMWNKKHAGELRQLIAEYQVETDD